MRRDAAIHFVKYVKNKKENPERDRTGFPLACSGSVGVDGRLFVPLSHLRDTIMVENRTHRQSLLYSDASAGKRLNLVAFPVDLCDLSHLLALVPEAGLDRHDAVLILDMFPVQIVGIEPSRFCGHEEGFPLLHKPFDASVVLFRVDLAELLVPIIFFLHFAGISNWEHCWSQD